MGVHKKQLELPISRSMMGGCPEKDMVGVQNGGMGRRVGCGAEESGGKYGWSAITKRSMPVILTLIFF
jgi:hypothetical protein